MVKQCLSSRFLLNCGVQEGFQPDGSGALHLKEERASAFFISRTYDSGKHQTQWGRVVLGISKSAVLQVYVWLFDEKKEGDAIDGMEDIKGQLSYIQAHAQYYSNYREMLLYGNEQGRGRFAKLAVEVTSGEENGVFTSYAITFPKESFTEYLPRIYRGNVQLERFLAVQQSIYLEQERKIDSLAEELDYECCGAKQAERLLKWMGWGELAGQLEDETVRELLKTGIFLASRKGTCAYYTRLTEILTGKKAVMIEEPEKSRAVVLVLEPPENGREKHLEWLRRNVPLCVSIEFVVLQRTDQLDGRYFLDATSYLSEYESVLLDNGVCIDCMTLL